MCCESVPWVVARYSCSATSFLFNKCRELFLTRRFISCRLVCYQFLRVFALLQGGNSPEVHDFQAPQCRIEVTLLVFPPCTDARYPQHYYCYDSHYRYHCHYKHGAGVLYAHLWVRRDNCHPVFWHRVCWFVLAPLGFWGLLFLGWLYAGDVTWLLLFFMLHSAMGVFVLRVTQ